MDIIIDTYRTEYWEAIKKLEQIPEIGLNMNRFLSEGHLASWAGVAPENNESGEKEKAGEPTKEIRD